MIQFRESAVGFKLVQERVGFVLLQEALFAPGDISVAAEYLIIVCFDY